METFSSLALPTSGFPLLVPGTERPQPIARPGFEGGTAGTIECCESLVDRDGEGRRTGRRGVARVRPRAEPPTRRGGGGGRGLHRRHVGGPTEGRRGAGAIRTRGQHRPGAERRRPGRHP